MLHTSFMAISSPVSTLMQVYTFPYWPSPVAHTNITSLSVWVTHNTHHRKNYWKISSQLYLFCCPSATWTSPSWAQRAWHYRRTSVCDTLGRWCCAASSHCSACPQTFGLSDGRPPWGFAVRQCLRLDTGNKIYYFHSLLGLVYLCISDTRSIQRA